MAACQTPVLACRHNYDSMVEDCVHYGTVLRRNGSDGLYRRALPLYVGRPHV